MPFDSNIILILIILALAMFLFIILYFFSRYKKFNTNIFIIHLRNGKIKSASLGGNYFVMPLTDEIIKIPAQVQVTGIEIHSAFSSTGHETSISATFMWRVIKPEIAYMVVSWDREKPNFVDRVMNELASGAFIEEALKMETDWSGTSWIPDLKKNVASRLHDDINDYGIVIEAIEIHVPGQKNASSEKAEESSLLTRLPSD